VGADSGWLPLPRKPTPAPRLWRKGRLSSLEKEKPLPSLAAVLSGLFFSESNKRSPKRYTAANTIRIGKVLTD